MFNLSRAKYIQSCESIPLFQYELFQFFVSIFELGFTNTTWSGGDAVAKTDKPEPGSIGEKWQ